MTLFNSGSAAYSAVSELRQIGFRDDEIQSITHMSREQLYRAEVGKLAPVEDRRAVASYLAFVRNAKRYAVLVTRQ